MRPKKVAIMVLNFNGMRWLAKCFSSVMKTDYPRYDVYLIDNGSADGSVAYVAKEFPSVKVIQNMRNLGYSEAYNSATKQVDADYYVLLNNDTEVLTSSWVSELVSIAESERRVGAVTCKMVAAADHGELDSVGGMGIPFWRGFVDIGRGERDRGQYDRFEPFAFCGGAALIRKEAFAQVGGFDERLFMYVEDVDLSWRLRLACWSIRLAPSAKVAHYLGGTMGRTVTPMKLYYCHRNLLRLILKNCDGSLPWAVFSYLAFTAMMILGFSLFEPRRAIIVLRTLAWNLNKLPNTMKYRRLVQIQRRVDDDTITRLMYPPIPRYQPAEHVILRRILNLFFERASRFLFFNRNHIPT